MTITSPHNPNLKELRRLHARRRARELAGRFVAEGEDLLAAAQAAGWPALEAYRAAGSGAGGPDAVDVDPTLLADVSELGSGTRALAVYATRWAPRPLGPLCVALYGVHDPGNVGTILRSAVGFGAGSVCLGPGCADPFGPKAVRASMGAVFEMPLVHLPAGPAEELPGPTVALDAEVGIPLHELSLPSGASLLVGAERAGLPDAVRAAADHVARIPIATHSLNAAMAATVALYELAHRITPAA